MQQAEYVEEVETGSLERNESTPPTVADPSNEISEADEVHVYDVLAEPIPAKRQQTEAAQGVHKLMMPTTFAIEDAQTDGQAICGCQGHYRCQ